LLRWRVCAAQCSATEAKAIKTLGDTSIERAAAGIEQVSIAVGSMDVVAQQNAALVERGAAAAPSLDGRAERLRQTVAAFSLGSESDLPVWI
jgi:methyl-accepting chemotaxis protein